MLEHIKALEDSLITDYLTGLRNRRYLFERGATMLEETRTQGGYLVAAMADIDHFKIVNDTYGHDGGDEALKHCSKILRNHFLDHGVVARFGGEEFCILMNKEDTRDIAPIFDKVRREIESSPFMYGNREIQLTISIGVSWKKTSSLENLVVAADACLYKAKEAGRNQVNIDQD